MPNSRCCRTTQSVLTGTSADETYSGGFRQILLLAVMASFPARQLLTRLILRLHEIIICVRHQIEVGQYCPGSMESKHQDDLDREGLPMMNNKCKTNALVHPAEDSAHELITSTNHALTMFLSDLDRVTVHLGLLYDVLSSETSFPGISPSLMLPS